MAGETPAYENQVNKYLSTYTTFSGADIVATFGGVEIGALSGITFSVTREKAPIYTMGSPNPRSFSRGKRGIAGSLIFTVFDRPALYTMLEKNYSASKPMDFYTRAHNTLPGDQNSIGRGIPGLGNKGSQTWTRDVQKKVPYYADQIPPFDITITFVNEYGNAAVRSIYGCELLNEGSGASMDDIVIEETMTYVARELGPMYTIATTHLESANNTLANIVNPAANTLPKSGTTQVEIIRP
jgi:hypothetical protein